MQSAFSTLTIIIYVAIQDYVLKEIYGWANIFEILNWKMRGIGYDIMLLKWWNWIWSIFLMKSVGGWKMRSEKQHRNPNNNQSNHQITSTFHLPLLHSSSSNFLDSKDFLVLRLWFDWKFCPPCYITIRSQKRERVNAVCVVFKNNNKKIGLFQIYCRQYTKAQHNKIWGNKHKERRELEKKPKNPKK
jgi:hypothetical protein